MTAKYRAKRIDNNEWVYGVPVYCESGECFILNRPRVPESDYDDDLYCVVDDFQVDPETVGQFTGLQDTNNIDIYEGDVMGFTFDCEYHKTCPVKYEPGWAAFATTLALGETNPEDLYILGAHNDRGSAVYEVIGNVHDNPELVK